jgi:gluconate kinase
MEKNNEKITVITGRPADGKTTVGRLLHEKMGFICIEGDDFITPAGKIRLNNGTWNDTDRRIYISRMAAAAVESRQDNPDVVIVDCLTTVWMREFLIRQIQAVNQSLAVGFILIERELSNQKLNEIALERSSHGHALDVSALVKFRHDFEPWNSHVPAIHLINPGDGDFDRLIFLTSKALKELWP